MCCEFFCVCSARRQIDNDRCAHNAHEWGVSAAEGRDWPGRAARQCKQLILKRVNNNNNCCFALCVANFFWFDKFFCVCRPEPIKKKFLVVCVDPRKKFTRQYADDGRCEEYHSLGYDDKGSHWEVWPKTQVITLKHNNCDAPPAPLSMIANNT